MEAPYLEERYRPALDRLASEPDLLDEFETGSWVAFDGAVIVASGATSEATVALAQEQVVERPLIVPVLSPTPNGGG